MKIYEKTISKKYNSKIFHDFCESIDYQKHGLKKNDLMIDVDGTMIQIFQNGNDKIKIVNDVEIDAVYVDSTIKLADL